MEQVVFLIGGNMGDRTELINQAEEKLMRYMELVKASSLYETAAWGGHSAGNYLNKALLLRTDMTPESVLNMSQQIEKELGRERLGKWGDRTMDIDVIYYGKEVIDTDRLNIPHPLMAERRFVLEPLVEIMPDFVHPVIGMTNQELLENCTDESKVVKV